MKTLVAVAVAFLMAAGASRASDTYQGTFYVAGMGGHFARARIVIDPAKPEAPIALHALDKIDIGSRQSHPTHDPRIDGADQNVMFWSTYQQDKRDEFANVALSHVGKTDLRTGRILLDKLVDIPSFADQKASLYCASAQTRDHFIPIAMSNRGYIDIFNKSDLKLLRRVTLEGTEADIGRPYRYYHGTNSPDYKRLLVTINEARSDHGETIGKIHLLELDLEKFIDGEIEVLNKNIAPGNGPFVSFRQYYSPDGSMIANSAGNALLMIDAKTLEVTDHEPIGRLNENHDAIFTPDGKYVIAAMRSKTLLPNCEDPKNPNGNEFIMDGQLQLYDVQAGKFIGKAVSVCATCHRKEEIDEHAVLCGVDAIFH